MASCRGYDYEHRQIRAALIPAAMGTLCPARVDGGCDRLMINPARMHLDHTVPLAEGGQRGDRIICMHCNSVLGGRLAQSRARGLGRAPSLRSRDW